MFKNLNRIAKAIVAWAIPTATVLVSVSSDLAGITEDGIVSGAEWQLLGVGIISGLLTYFKRNTPPPVPGADVIP